ncbi:MAG: DNA polymerase I [Chlamydiales bacterium]|nr:DNA polymerase I [Chlamydiales bacterium]NCF70777.1 DNA polymerase I [Chlamydiales bacterium]
MKENDIYIVDATGVIFRSYFAIRGMSNSRGESTNGIFGFIRSFKKLLQDFSPENIVAIFDPIDGKSKRVALYQDYKAHRESPDDIHMQIEWAKKFCELYGIPHLCIPGYEADDTIASVARFMEKKDRHVWVCSQDKDLAQLINEHVSMLQPHKDNLIINLDNAESIYGVRADQMADYLAIVGDSSDNVPGIKGFGPKTAVALLNDYNSLDGIYENIDSIKAVKKQQTLVDEKEKAYLSKQLVELAYEVEIPKEVDFYQLKEISADALKEFYLDLNFNTLVQELSNQTSSTGNSKEDIKYTLVNDKSSFESLKARLTDAKEICFDTETTGLHPLVAEAVGVGFCVKEKEAFYLPLNGDLSKESIVEFLQELFSDSSKEFFAHNAKYDCHILANMGLPYPNISFDTILASYLLNAANRNHSLDSLSMELFGKEKISIKSLIGSGKKQIGMDEVPLDSISEYCCEDCDYTFRLKELFAPQLNKEGLNDLLVNLELPLAKLLFDMERHGIFVKKDALKILSVEFREKLEELEKSIFNDAGEEFKINSPKQLSHILFEKLNIPPPKKNKTGFSTDASVMETLRLEYPIAQKILEYRQYEKLLSTYVDALPIEICSKTNRVHSTFNQSVAATGRLSSQKPNLQNIPIRTQEGRRIRETFCPEKPDWSLISADYSQIELRILAHMSEDPNLIKAFQENKDVHQYTASLIFNTSLEEVSYEQRYQAKAVNFGILYGQQAFGLSKELGIPVKAAAEFIERYFDRYDKVKEFIEKCKLSAEEAQEVHTLINRKRKIPDILSKNKMIKQAAERLAVNTPIQGTAADIIKLAMLKVSEEIKNQGLKGYMILQIHDELVFEVPDEEVDKFKKIVKNSMEEVYPLKVPLTVNIEVGKNWREC